MIGRTLIKWSSMNRKDNDSKLTMNSHVSQNKYIDSHSQTVTHMLERKLNICKNLQNYWFQIDFFNDIQELSS